MSAENGQNFVKNSDFKCLSVDGASAMSLPLHGIVPDFSDTSILDSNEPLITSGHHDIMANDLFIDRCSMCQCIRSEDSDQEFPSELSKVSPFHGFLHWLCPTCERVVEDECKRARLKANCSHSPRCDSCDEASSVPHCPCINCQSDRESSLHQKKEFQKIWTTVAEAVGRVFGAECAATVLSTPDLLVLKSHVAKLCQMNCHYLFKKLEKRCRQMLINMKVHILKKTARQKTDTADVAYNFMSIILHKYMHLCTACEFLADVLSPLVEQHMSQFNATWQLHNKYLFCCVIFNEPVVQKCLPEAAEIISQDLLKKKQQEKLSKEQETLMRNYDKVLSEHERFVKEMTDVDQFWKSCQKNIEKYDETYEIEKMKERKHCLIDGLEFIKKQRQLLKEIQGGCLSADAFDNSKRVESFEKLWIHGRADETQCPNCRTVKCSYDEAGMSHLITCGIISPDIISEEGLSPTSFEKHEPDFQEYLNSASVRSTSSSSDDSFLPDGHVRKERRRGDGEVSSEDEDDEDEDEEEEDDDEDDDDDDFHDAQQIHLPDFCPSIENSSSELVNRCNQSFLLQPREVVPYCNCLNCNKESLCLLSYSKKNPKHILKFMLKANQNGEEEEDDDDDDEDYDIHEGGIHTSGDLEYATMAPLTNAELLLKTSHFIDYPAEASFSPKSIIENLIDYSTQPPFSQKTIVENNFSQRFLLPTLEQQCSQERNKCLRLCTNERQVLPPSSSPGCIIPDVVDAVTSLEDQFNSSLSLNHCCTSKIQNSTNPARSPTKITEHKILKTLTGSHNVVDEASCCEIKIQRNDTTGNSSDKKSGKDRSTQHPEKILPQNDKKSTTSCNYYQVALKHPNSCQKQQQQQQQQVKAASQPKPGSGDGGSVSSSNQKQGSFTVPQQPSKQSQESNRCRAPSCNGHMVGAGDGGLDKEECSASPHSHLPSCEADDKSLGGQKDLNGKSHCECWHCEFFGHETQSNAPTSKNFAECRDRLRQKLKKKQSSSKTTQKGMASMSHNSAPASKSSSPEQSSGLKSVDELIDYINGGKKNIDQSAKEQRKSSGIKKKSGKNKKTKDIVSKSTSEMASSSLIDDNKSHCLLQRRQTSNSPSSVSSKSMPETKNEEKSKDTRVHPTTISGSVATSTASLHSSLENSVPMLKINSSKKFEIPPGKEAGEKKIDPAVRKDPLRTGCSQQDKLISLSKALGSNVDCLIDSVDVNSKTVPNSDLKVGLTPPPSPRSKSKKIDARKTSDQSHKQKASIQKADSLKNSISQSKEVKENGTCRVSFTSKQTKASPSTACLLSGMITVLSKANGTCKNAKPSSDGCRQNHAPVVVGNDAKSSVHLSAESSPPPSSSKTKKQKKRNKMSSDLSFEEIFKPNDEEDLGEDDREIEEFKRFCFNTPPLPVREKLRVNLNVKDIFNRRKPPQSCNS